MCTVAICGGLIRFACSECGLSSHQDCGMWGVSGGMGLTNFIEHKHGYYSGTHLKALKETNL